MPVTKEMVSARTDLRASTKMAVEVCKKLNGRRFAEAKDFAEKLVKKEVSIDRVYYTKAAEGILGLLKTIEFNAKNRDMDPAGMKLNISAHQGPRMMRARHKRRFGTRLKMTHVQAVLVPAKKEVAKEEKTQRGKGAREKGRGE